MSRFPIAISAILASCSSGYPIEVPKNMTHQVAFERDEQPHTASPIWLNATFLSDGYHYYTLIDRDDNCAGLIAGFDIADSAIRSELESLDSDRNGVAVTGEFFGIMELDDSDETRRFTISDYRNASVRHDLVLGTPIDWSSCPLANSLD